MTHRQRQRGLGLVPRQWALYSVLEESGAGPLQPHSGELGGESPGRQDGEPRRSLGRERHARGMLCGFLTCVDGLSAGEGPGRGRLDTRKCRKRHVNGLLAVGAHQSISGGADAT